MSANRSSASVVARLGMLILLVLANLAIAGPVSAGWLEKDAWCMDGEDAVPCCVFCFLIGCGCEIVMME